MLTAGNMERMERPLTEIMSGLVRHDAKGPYAVLTSARLPEMGKMPFHPVLVYHDDEIKKFCITPGGTLGFATNPELSTFLLYFRTSTDVLVVDLSGDVDFLLMLLMSLKQADGLIFAECSDLHRLLEVFVRGTDDSKVGMNNLAASHPRKLFRLDHTK